ncbi:hypothetical protein BGX24_002252 [Mortierella sp. AD032]|nr:hypothetical protein BGX24_002252 [Mortierella sp. AD032]
MDHIPAIEEDLEHSRSTMRSSLTPNATKGPVRCRLHRQIKIKGFEEYLHFTVGANTTQLSPQLFKLHYVELETCFSDPKTAAMTASCMATDLLTSSLRDTPLLDLTKVRAVVSVWDLLSQTDSSNGGCAFAAPKDTVSCTHILTQRSACERLKSFVGFGAFHRVDPSMSSMNEDNDNERFLALNGSVLEVYSTSTSEWIQLQQIELTQDLGFHREHSYGITQSLCGRRFAWNGVHGVISIWDFEKAKMLSHIFVDTDTSDVRPVLSPDGSKFAISGN